MAPDPRIVMLLAQARGALDQALALMATANIELPPGVELPEGACTHPKDKRHETFGGHGYCTACGEKW